MIAVWDLVRDAALPARPMGEAAADWDTVLLGLTDAPARYTRSMVTYQNAYAAATADTTHDLSMVFYVDKTPAGIWPLALRKVAGNWVCETVAGEVYPPLFRGDLSEKRCKSFVKGCLQVLDSLCRATSQTAWKGTASVGPTGVDLWHRGVMARGAQISVTHELFCDLSLSVDEIRRNFRKSYKPLLTMGARLWHAAVLDKVSSDVFAEYQALHAEVAGRVTRSQATWDLQEQAINEGSAFLVVLRDQEGRLVGGGFFTVSHSEGLYAVGAYDRSLFHLPLGHVVQWNAIEHMKRLGLRWYRLGDRPYPSDAEPPTEKEVDIATFKEGFATHMFVRVHAVCPVTPAS